MRITLICPLLAAALLFTNCRERRIVDDFRRADLISMAMALEVYRKEVGHYPSTEEGLQAVVDRHVSESALIDRYGRPYRYIGPSTKEGLYDLYSTGENLEDDRDDIHLEKEAQAELKVSFAKSK